MRKFGIILMFLCALGESRINYDISEIIVEFCDVSKMLLKKCWSTAGRENTKYEIVHEMRRCLEESGTKALDRLSNVEVINLPFGVKLVKNSQNVNDTMIRRSSARDWMGIVLERLTDIFRTHTIRFSAGNVIEARRRKQESSLLLFGMMAMAIIAVPLGFQFLAVLGGKALLLAKMALMLSAIQGLKKIATSDVHYGFYAGGHDRPPHVYDRKSHPSLDIRGYDVLDEEFERIYPLKSRYTDNYT